MGETDQSSLAMMSYPAYSVELRERDGSAESVRLFAVIRAQVVQPL